MSINRKQCTEHISIYEYSSTTCTEAVESKKTLGEKIVEKNRDRKNC
jgi:hypothetical protein